MNAGHFIRVPHSRERRRVVRSPPACLCPEQCSVRVRSTPVVNPLAGGGDPQPTVDYVDGDDRFDDDGDSVTGPPDAAVEEEPTAS